MLTRLTSDLIPAFTQACAHERVFGSRIITALRTYGPEDARALFWLLLKDDSPAAALQGLLGGTTDSSYYMVYQGAPVEEAFPDIVPGDPLAVFSVLQRSHEYYRTHLRFEPWAEDLGRRLNTGLAEVYQLELDGEVVATGSIASQDDECGVIAAVAVVPEYRLRGLGSRVSRFLVKRILELGKTPRLISGYDAVAELYRQVGFDTCGRWGELYL